MVSNVMKEVYESLVQSKEIEDNIYPLLWEKNDLTKGMPGLTLFKRTLIQNFPIENADGAPCMTVRINDVAKDNLHLRVHSPEGTYCYIEEDPTSNQWRSNGYRTLMHKWHRVAPAMADMLTVALSWYHAEQLGKYMKANRDQLIANFKDNGKRIVGKCLD